MSISTFAELKTAVADYTHRSDLTSYIPDFIRGAEDLIAYGGPNSDRIYVADMITRATASIDEEYEDLPTGAIEIINIQLNTNPKVSLDYLTPEQIDQRDMGSSTGKPLAYSIVGDKFQFAPSPDAAYTGEIVYLKKYTAFSSDADTNWLLTNHPFLYLYGSLVKANEFIKDTEEATRNMVLYDALANRINQTEQRKRFSGSKLRSRSRVIA